MCVSFVVVSVAALELCRRPANDEWNLGVSSQKIDPACVAQRWLQKMRSPFDHQVLLRQKGVEKPPIGYFEICMQKPEGLGRPRLDSLDDRLQLCEQEDPLTAAGRRSAAHEPYLKNLCVSKAPRKAFLRKVLAC